MESNSPALTFGTDDFTGEENSSRQTPESIAAGRQRRQRLRDSGFAGDGKQMPEDLRNLLPWFHQWFVTNFGLGTPQPYAKPEDAEEHRMSRPNDSGNDRDLEGRKISLQKDSHSAVVEFRQGRGLNYDHTRSSARATVRSVQNGRQLRMHSYVNFPKNHPYRKFHIPPWQTLPIALAFKNFGFYPSKSVTLITKSVPSFTSNLCMR